ncbi:MAG: hypothetical protein GY754_02730 [bacterium]|nr:hypothetical protein [bacterium]
MIRETLARLTGFKSGITKELIDKTDDNKLLKEIIFSHAPVALKRQAVGKISGENLLKEIANSTVGRKIVIAAIKRIKDEKFLSELVLKCTSDSKQFKNSALFALGQIHDAEIIYNIAMNAENHSIRKKCIERIRDPEHLTTLMNNEKVKKLKKIISGKLEKHMPVTLMITIEFQCPYCSQPVFVNGPVQKMSCPFCTSEIAMETPFWKEILSDSIEGGSYTSLGYSHGVKGLDLGAMRKNAACLSCSKEIESPYINPKEVKSISCSHCKQENPVITPPSWMEELTVKKRKVLYVLCAEDEHYEEEFYKSVKPVVTSCIQCGGNLKIKKDTPRNAACRYCGTVQYIPDPLWFALHPVKIKKPWYVVWSHEM